MSAPAQLHRTLSMDRLRQSNTPHSQDFTAVSSGPSDHLGDRLGSHETLVPKEFTAQGTTPSGKPRVFVCAMCTRAFARLEHLRRHERSHTKEKPFDCGVCQRKFLRRDLLLRHAQKLHAGCDDAVARMRRKLSKLHSASASISGSVSGSAGVDHDTDRAMGTLSGSRTPNMGSSRPEQGRPGLFQGLQTALDPPNFNLNSFAGASGRNHDLLQSPVTPASRMSRASSIKDSSLKKQLFDKRKPGFRRASFSAQSGPNYAMVPPQHYDSSTAENVEFSTPQFLPTFAADEESWLSNLCTIPGMSSQNAHPAINEQPYSYEHEFPKHTAMFGGGMHLHVMHPEPIVANSSNGHQQYISQHTAYSGTPASVNHEEGYTGKLELEDTGYSFYDIPESLTSRSIPPSSGVRPLSPIRQELEDELMDLEHQHLFSMKTMPVPANMSHDQGYSGNHLNDLDELGQLFEDGSKKLLGGYSFYGDNPLIPSTGLESISSHASASPSIIQAANPQLLAKGSYLNGSHFDTDAHIPLEDQFENTSLFEHGYSRTTLFTKNMRLMIKRALNKYPISDVMAPTIPSDAKMEFFLRTFIDRFLSYFPFIHPSKLNEYDIMDMTSDEDPQNDSARICLPLLAATLGALLANNKADLDQLYEASRRTVHIYLESRKSVKNERNNHNQLTNPLWLIQSLTLSVMYGLFSDGENNVYIVIRQLNALNCLVKTSLKNNHEVFFAINGQDQMVNNFAKEGNWNAAREALNYVSENEVKFKHAIAMQSQVRSALAIYQLTNFILMMFNVPLTLSATDLGSLTCPNTHDEFLWRFNNYNDFENYLQTMGVQRDLEFFLAKDESNTIVFQDILKRLCLNQIDGAVTSKLTNLSKFGFNCLVKGVFEFMLYENYKFMDTSVVLNYLTFFVNSTSRNQHTGYLNICGSPNEKLDYALLVNFVEICSVVDFQMVKEQSWLKSYDMLNKNFHVFLNNMENLSDFNFMKIVDNCLAITKLVIFKVEDSDNQYGDGEFQTEAVGHHFSEDLHSSESGISKSIGLRVLHEISFTTSPILSQILFHVFVIFSIFAVYMAKRNNPATLVAQSHSYNETWQLNQKFIALLKILVKFEEHLRLQFENHQLDAEMTNLFLLLSGNSNDLVFENSAEGFSGDGEQHNSIFAYSLDKSLYVLRVGELMMRMLYEHNIQVVILKKLSASMSQIRKYLIDEEHNILR